MCGGYACVARKNDATAEAWGGRYGGDTSNGNRINVADVMCGRYACVARNNDGTEEVWGSDVHRGDGSI